mgnify:CR=1 FL=1
MVKDDGAWRARQALNPGKAAAAEREYQKSRAGRKTLGDYLFLGGIGQLVVVLALIIGGAYLGYSLL